MKLETIRCDVCGVITTNKSESINGKDYCRSCARSMGIALWQ